MIFLAGGRDAVRMRLHGGMNILHCGGNNETAFIEYLNGTLGQTVALRYTTFRQERGRDGVLFNDAHWYSASDQPTLVLISQEFFDMMWETGYKAELIRLITDRRFVHVWMDGVSENLGEDIYLFALPWLIEGGLIRREGGLISREGG